MSEKVKNTTTMKPILVFLSILAAVLPVCSCSDDPVLGKYKAQTASVLNVSVPLDKIAFGEPLLIDLKKEGIGTLAIQGNEEQISWETAEEGILTLIIDGSGETMTGIIADRILTLTMLSADVVFTRTK